MLHLMIIGIGIDIVDVMEVQQTIDDQKELYLERVFTAEEVSYARSTADPYQRLAARLAAKEAAMKALGTGWNDGIEWRDIEVSNENTGKPILRFHSKTAERAQEMGVRAIWLTLAHTPTLATAEVILEG